jgi:DNA-binding Xre family transcriptional regulator
MRVAASYMLVTSLSTCNFRSYGKRMDLLKKATQLPLSWYQSLGLGMERALVKPARDNFASNLDNLMTEKNMSDAELARRLHVSRMSVGRWRNGKAPPSFEYLDSIAETLGCSVKDLFTDPTDDRTTGMDLKTALAMVAEVVKTAKPPTKN